MRHAFGVLVILFLSVDAPVPADIPNESPTETATEPTVTLPPPDYVRRVRSARVAMLQEEHEHAAHILRQVVEDYPDQLAAQELMLQIGRTEGALGEAELAEILEQLHAHLADLERPVPIGTLRYLVASPGVDEPVLDAVRDRLRAEAVDEPITPERLEILADILQRRGDVDAALETLDRLYELTGEERLLWDLYTFNARRGNWRQAAHYLRLMVENGAEGLRSNLVRVLARAGEYEAMMAEIETLEAQGLQALLTPMLADLAWSLHDAGQAADAKKLFELAAADGDDSADIEKTLLYLYGSAEEQESKAAELEAAWREEEDPRALFDQGTQLLTVGDVEAAVGLLERAAAGLPELEAAWYNYALAAYRLERWEPAAEAFARAAHLNPRRAQSHLYRGMALVELERCGEALAPLENAVGLDAAGALPHYHLSHCYRALGETAAADEHWRLYEEKR